MTTILILTANHKGFTEFRLCNLDNNENSDVIRECLNRRLLKIVGTDPTTDESGSRSSSRSTTWSQTVFNTKLATK
jgi:hypothetical protein